MFPGQKPSTSRFSNVSDALTFSMLIRKQEGLYQVPFAADDHSWKSLEPLSVGDVWRLIKPGSQQLELICWDSPILNPA